MTRTSLLIDWRNAPSSATESHRGLCPFGANCSCAFSGRQADPEPTPTARRDPRLTAEARKWTSKGWKIVASDATEVFLERQVTLSFCLNVLLCLATAFLWLAYWVPRMKNPRVARRVMTIGGDGRVVIAAVDSRP